LVTRVSVTTILGPEKAELENEGPNIALKFANWSSVQFSSVCMQRTRFWGLAIISVVISPQFLRASASDFGALALTIDVCSTTLSHWRRSVDVNSDVRIYTIAEHDQVTDSAIADRFPKSVISQRGHVHVELASICTRPTLASCELATNHPGPTNIYTHRKTLACSVAYGPLSRRHQWSSVS